MKKFFVVAFLFSSICIFAQEQITISDSLYVQRISTNVLLHVSQLSTTSFGRVECNGLIYMNGNEAVIMDTPAGLGTSQQLFNWFSATYPGVTIKGVIVNHFHDDCLAGLPVFHKAGINSYSHRLTPIMLQMKEDTSQAPKTTFDKELTIKVGGKEVKNYYLGEAHTRDNIVTWIPDEKVIFGGCVIKTMNATKGYLGDANTDEWSATVTRIKEKFPKVKVVVPGHGPHGGIELLDYTIALFRE